MARPVPTPGQIAWGVKPLVWLLALAPALWLGWRIQLAFGGDPAALGADPAETIVHESGEAAIQALLATLVVGFARDVFGLSWLVRLRRLLGLFAFAWACTHLGAYVWLELEGDPLAVLSDLSERPYIIAGAGAVLAMLPLAITSTNGWRRRLGRRWTQLHRLVWLAALGASVHLVWQARADLGEAVLYGALFAALAAQRLWTARGKGRRRRAAAPA